MIYIKSLVCLSLVLAASAARADVTELTYKKTDIGGGLFQYDFKLTLTNHDMTYSPGQGFNWIIFGDVPGPGTSTLDDWVPLSDSFPNTNMVYTFSSGGHNGPTYLDAVNLSTDGWIPTGVGDSVTWNGISANDVPDGAMFFSALISINGANLPNFQVAVRIPEPAAAMTLGVLAACSFLARRRRSQGTCVV